MLVGIKSDILNSMGLDNDKIIFNPSLNIITNNYDVNGILMLIDYCFGGNKFIEHRKEEYLGYEVEFVFLLNGKKWIFGRHTSHPKDVKVYTEGYRKEESWDINKYKKWLMKEYGIQCKDIELWKFINRFFRIIDTYAFDEIAYDSRELYVGNANEIEKIYNQYDDIEIINNNIKSLDVEKKTYSSLLEYEKIRNEGILFHNKDEDKIGLDDEYAKQEIKLRKMMHRHRELTLKYNLVSQSVSESTNVRENDLSKLSFYFPDVNIRRIKEIQNFHTKLYSILKEEREEELESLEVLILEVKKAIAKLRGDIESNYDNHQVDVQEVKGYIKRRIDELNNEMESVKRLLIKKENEVILDIENKINAHVEKYSNDLFESKRVPLKIKVGKHNHELTSEPMFAASIDMIAVADASILKSSLLPAIAYDERILQNIDTKTIDKLLLLYQGINKQIFIPFDFNKPHGEEAIGIAKSCMIKLKEWNN